MDTQNNIRRTVQELIASEDAGCTGLAAKLNVSESTVSRWESGYTKPRSGTAEKLRILAKELVKLEIREPIANYERSEPEYEEHFRSRIHSTLTAIRETLHRSGRLSSRHEALDEVSKLLFAHIISIAYKSTGINPDIITSQNTVAKSLRKFVREIFKKHIPESLSLELSASDFDLKLKDSENKFASELISCFDDLDASAIRPVLAGSCGVDVLNEVFGQFLADSFSDEKELGQYLTPSEVVQFMTRLGLGSLSLDVLNKLTDPISCKQSGVVLDPSCGVGSFLTEVIKTLHPEVVSCHGISKSQKWVDNMLRSVLVGIDKSERMVRLALTNLALFGSNVVTLHLANALARNGHDGKVSSSLEGSVQLILTNPPFGAEFSGTDIDSYKIATDWSSKPIKSLDSELLFMERYIDWLAPGGTLVTIVPDSILTNRGIFNDLRLGLSDKIELCSVISLPPVTFGAAGTTTKTSILHLVKRKNGHEQKPVYYSICDNIGYEVTTRASQRRKVANGKNDLIDILPEATRKMRPKHGRFVKVRQTEERWDATYHVGLSSDIARRIKRGSKADLYVRDVAILSSLRVNPSRSLGTETFSYIEISDVNSSTLDVDSKELPCNKAPSRARKLVRTGNVLVSTVRPERKIVAVVPPHLDGAVCTTGFAVLECRGIDPTVFALLLQTDFVNEQVLRNNIGIAYPAINEGCLLDILLPVNITNLDSLAGMAEKVRSIRSSLLQQEHKLHEKIESAVTKWNNNDPG